MNRSVVIGVAVAALVAAAVVTWIDVRQQREFRRLISTGDAALRDLLSNANKVTAVLAKRSDQIAALVSNANALLTELLCQRNSIDAIFSRCPWPPPSPPMRLATPVPRRGRLPQGWHASPVAPHCQWSFERQAADRMEPSIQLRNESCGTAERGAVHPSCAVRRS